MPDLTDADGLRAEAARLALALLRFEETAAHLSGASTPPGSPRLGTEAYVFVPSWKPIPSWSRARYAGASRCCCSTN